MATYSRDIYGREKSDVLTVIIRQYQPNVSKLILGVRDCKLLHVHSGADRRLACTKFHGGRIQFHCPHGAVGQESHKPRNVGARFNRKAEVLRIYAVGRDGESHQMPRTRPTDIGNDRYDDQSRRDQSEM